MRVTVDEKMKTWVREYIRSHRRDGCVSIHVVYSKFNEDFKSTFKMDPRSAVTLMIAEGFLMGMPALNGFSIWLPEDAGQGKGRPFKSRAKSKDLLESTVVQKKELSVIPTQIGENKMKMVDVHIQPEHSFEFIRNPETGKADILGLIGFIMKKLGEKLPSKPEMDGGYAVIKMSLFPSLLEMGLPRGSFDDLSRIMQDMALIRKYPKSHWGILHEKAAVYFMTPSLYNIAKEEMKWRDQRNSEVAKLRNKMAGAVISQCGEGVADVVQVTSAVAQASFEDEAIAALAEAERLAEELVQKTALLAEMTAERNALSQQLNERPQHAEVIKQAFHERLSALKVARV